jgi:hypothetical protein
MDNNQSNTKSNKGVELNLTRIVPFYSIWLWILILIIILVYLLSGAEVKVPNSSSLDPTEYEPSKETTQIIGEIFLILFIVLIIFILCLAFIPNFKELKDLFINISSVTYVIIYTIFLVLFFANIPSSTLNMYPYFFTILPMLIGGFSFYKAYATDYAKEFNINYERIKMMMLFFCMITVFIIFYSVNPGGLITEYLGSAAIVCILIGVFSLLYIIVLFTLTNNKKIPIVETSGNIFKNFTKFSYYGSILFFVFLITVTIWILNFPGGFLNNSNIVRSSAIIILILWITLLWGCLLISNLFPEITNNNILVSKLDIFKRSLLLLFGIALAILVIIWFCLTMQNSSSTSGIFNFIFNLILLLVMLSAIYKMVIMRAPVGNEQKNVFLNLITNIIFYIPCLFTNSFDGIIGVFNDNKDKNHYFTILFIVILLYLLYFLIPPITNKFFLQGGKVLLKEPTITNQQLVLGNYESLNKNGDIKYNFAISFWLFLNSFEQNSSGNKYTTIVNYARKPNIEYNAALNKLRITVRQAGLKYETDNKLINFTETGDRIIYISNKMPLQKWNNIIINFDGGTLDIFINGELVSSSNEVVPYYNLDNFVVGKTSGYIGSICNLIYFQKTLSKNNIYFLYDSLKNKSPPVLEKYYF